MTDVAPRITHVCISDLHAGALTSVLTKLNDKLKYQQGVTETCRTFGVAMGKTLLALTQGGSPPNLILLGDALELATSPTQRSFEVLQTFLGQLYAVEGALSEKLVFVPGNHDHTMWTSARYEKRAIKGEPPRLTGDACITPAFGSDYHSRLLEELLAGQDIAGATVPVFYPNFGLTSDHGRAVIFHHGHFIEPMYRTMSSLVALLNGSRAVKGDCDTLERFNGSWIDFGWSTLGDDGLLGEDVAIAYQSLLAGRSADVLQGRVASLLAGTVQRTVPLPHTLQMEHVLALAMRGLVDATVGKFSQLERYSYTQVLNPSSVAGLKSYLSEAVWPQIKAEREEIPQRITFVFGHTHKPFEDQVIADGFSEPVGVYNTGGWILDTSLLSTVEGASAVFVDEELNTAALRLFSMPVNGRISEVAVTTADIDPASGDNPLVERLRKAVALTDRLWADFSKAAAADLEQRQQMILAMTRDGNMPVRKRGAVP